MESTGIEVAANVLLRERATRQALVDRLRPDSFWAMFVSRMVLPLSTTLLFLGVSAVWSGGPVASILVAVVGTLVFWLGLELAQVNRRLYALAAVLESTGLVATFVDGSSRSGVLAVDVEVGATRSNKPLQPPSGVKAEAK